MSEIIGQQLIIDNRTGGNALVAANAVLQAPRDGQTFLIDAANQVTNPFLIKDLPFDYQKTWLPVTKLSDFPQVVAVKHDFPAKTIQEYIAAAKEKPGTISYGTPPAAGMGHMAGEELQRRAGIKLIHAPLSRRRRRRARHRRRRDRFGDHHHLVDPPAAGRRPRPRAGRHQPQARADLPRRADLGRVAAIPATT